jgi:hypothetical protein
MTMGHSILPLRGRWRPEGLTEGYSPLDGVIPLRQALRACHLPLQGRI